ncbi:5845_t:CDS:2 [Funneliformis mosseae]|uniref:5845_t:CDS:1 n=1 Tax=Funneliformis mosseae TaxID=27381 RepID=A0A9N9FLV8_FUNMO|nr:5845_t:CDS:2 [Funneliformis mosseae]
MITPRLFLLLTKYKHMKFEKGVKMNLDDIKMPKLFRTIKRKMSYKSHNCKECNWKRSAGENEPLLVDHIWCETCSPIQLQREFILWKSGNNEIDDFIRFQQIKAKTPSNLIEWIPYDRFTDIKYLEQGGFSIVYSATWMDGPIQGWNLEQKQWNRLSKTKVALKVLKDSQNISSEFLEELHLNLQRGSTYVVKCLGFTQEPKSKDYAMVLEFAENGNLRHYLNCNSNSIDCMIRCCFIYEDECKISHRISKEIEQCKCIHQTHPTEQTKIHPEANYHSRLLSFPKLEETLASGI